MPVYHTWNLLGKEIAPDKRYTDKRRAERLEEVLRELAMLLPESVKPKEPALVGSFLYNWDDQDGNSIELRLPCGHTYVLSGGNWHRPKCEQCEAEFERRVLMKSDAWHKKPIAVPKAEKPGVGSGRDKDDD